MRAITRQIKFKGVKKVIKCVRVFQLKIRLDPYLRWQATAKNHNEGGTSSKKLVQKFIYLISLFANTFSTIRGGIFVFLQ